MTAETFVFLLVPGLSMMSLVSAIEPLRSLNRLVGREAYRWHLASLEGEAVGASNGIALAAQPVQQVLAAADYFVVCGGLRVQVPEERRYLPVLRQAARRGIAVGALSTGTHLLARANLLKGYRCTIHWENEPAFREQFPDIPCTGKIYEIDRDRITCSGGTAAMDMMLRLIAARHGVRLARKVANQFHHERIRDESAEQRGHRESPRGLPAGLLSAIEIMTHHIEEPLALPVIAERVGLSARQLERLFLAHTNTSPLRYYIRLRVEHARDLLLYSDRPIIEIAVLAGFTSTSHFSTAFRRVTGVCPSEQRTRAQTVAAAELASCRTACRNSSQEDKSDGRASRI